MEAFEILPQTEGDKLIIPRTMRMTQNGRNKFFIKGTVEVDHRFGPRDKVNKLPYIFSVWISQIFSQCLHLLVDKNWIPKESWKQSIYATIHFHDEPLWNCKKTILPKNRWSVQLSISSRVSVSKSKFSKRIIVIINRLPGNVYQLHLNVYFQGNYTINDLQLDETFYPSVLPTGSNFIQINYLVDNKSVFGVKIFTNIQKTKWNK